MTALTLPDPQADEKGVYAHGWISFVGWVSGGAVALAYVIRPGVAIICSIFAPHVIIPDVPLNSMWPPVLAILGAGASRVGGNLVKLREARKTQEMTMKVCADCPTRDCASCPLKSMAGVRLLDPDPSTMDHPSPPAVTMPLDPPTDLRRGEAIL